MFAAVGVEIEWAKAKPAPGEIVLLLSPGRTGSYSAAAVAQARPYAVDGIRITISCEDVLSADGRGRGLQTALLAHVLVHEITRVLQGIARHSETGVMRAKWSRADILSMETHPLPFHPADAVLLRAVR